MSSRVASGMVGAAALVLGVFFPSAPEGWELGELSLAREVEAASCPKGMVSIEGTFCIDKYEAATVLVDGPRRGKHKPKVKKAHSPYKPVKGEHVMAVSEKGKVPQAHISRDEAEQACVNAGKRLCTDDEWLKVCKGKKPTQYPYGDERVSGACNDRGVSGFNLLFGPGNNTPPEPGAYNMENMNDPRLNQVEGSLAKAGAFPKCKNAYKVFDMVGNLHEWTEATAGTFRGGYYLDTAINGAGCDYRTTAHERTYHDYSTGFRCCAGGKEQERIENLFVKVAPVGKRDKAKRSDDVPPQSSKLAKGPKDKSKSKGKKSSPAKKPSSKSATNSRGPSSSSGQLASR